MSVCFDNENKFLLGASNDNCIRLWSLNNSIVKVIPILVYRKETLTGHIGKVYSAKFSDDSKRAVINLKKVIF